MEEVRDKRRIKGVIHYLVKQASQLLEYNSYEPASYLTNAPRVITAFKRKLKRKQKEAKAIDNNDNKDKDTATNTT